VVLMIAMVLTIRLLTLAFAATVSMSTMVV